jgi:Recombination endonuclease VII
MAVREFAKKAVDGQKECFVCKLVLPVTAFYPNRAAKDGVTTYCRICSRAKVRQWGKDNPEKVAVRRAKAYRRNPRRHLDYVAEWQRENYDKHLAANQRYRDRVTVSVKPDPQTLKVCTRCGEIKPRTGFHVFAAAPDGRAAQCVACYTKAARVKNYGISEEKFEVMWRDQEGLCLLCEDFLIPFGKGGCVIDHDHETGKVRGILCNQCNLGLGLFRENAETCERAASYLRKHKEGG